MKVYVMQLVESITQCRVCVLCNNTCDELYIVGGVFGAELSLCNVVRVLHNDIN